MHCEGLLTATYFHLFFFDRNLAAVVVQGQIFRCFADNKISIAFGCPDRQRNGVAMSMLGVGESLRQSVVDAEVRYQTASKGCKRCGFPIDSTNS